MESTGSGTVQTDEPKPLSDDHRADLEAAVTLVLEAGMSTGHADTCECLVRELLGQIGPPNETIK